MYPAIDPYDRGLLPVGDGNSIYWECSGNPNGRPVVYVHGGPGSGSTPGSRRYFDPAVYRIVVCDQRGCGRSQPLVRRPSDLRDNTTQRLAGDLDLLRRHLSIERWAMLGVSWGTTLALAYAQNHPDRVTGLVLGCVTTTSRREVEWITCGVGRLFPERWERFASHIPASLRNEPIADAYASLLFDGDPAVCAAAARAWCEWEETHVSLAPDFTPNPRFADPEFRLRFSRIVTHYWRHAAFLEDDQLVRDAARLDGIPGVLIHGRYDVSSPLETAWRLQARWRGSVLHVVDDAGHGGGSLSSHVAAALDALRGG